LQCAGVRGGVCDAGLGALTTLTGLTDLNLDSRKFSDAGIAAIAPLTGLRRLDAYSAHVTNAGCATLRCAPPRAYLPETRAACSILEAESSMTPIR